MYTGAKPAWKIPIYFDREDFLSSEESGPRHLRGANILINRPSDRFLAIDLESQQFPSKKRYQSTRYRFWAPSQIYFQLGVAYSWLLNVQKRKRKKEKKKCITR